MSFAPAIFPHELKMPCQKCRKPLGTNHAQCTYCTAACTDPGVVAKNTVAYSKAMLDAHVYKGWKVGTHVLVDDEWDVDFMNFTGIVVFPGFSDNAEEQFPETYHIISDRDSRNVVPGANFVAVKSDSVFIAYGTYCNHPHWPSGAIYKGAKVIATSVRCIEPVVECEGEVTACAVDTCLILKMYKVKFTGIPSVEAWCDACQVEDQTVAPASKYPVGTTVMLVQGLKEKRALILEHNWRNSRYLVEVFHNATGQRTKSWCDEVNLHGIALPVFPIYHEGRHKVGHRCLITLNDVEENVMVSGRVRVRVHEL